ncbi:MAG: hypothetical protein KGR46_02000 [Verrucomicrobia bacterium]|nr:hypothetical protein [Verrucomicrobiota bacterium]
MRALDTGKPEQLGKTGFETLRIKFGQSSLTLEKGEQKRPKSIAQGMGVKSPSITGNLAAKILEKCIFADIIQELINSQAVVTLAEFKASFLQWGERLTLKNWRESRHNSR